MYQVECTLVVALSVVSTRASVIMATASFAELQPFILARLKYTAQKLSLSEGEILASFPHVSTDYKIPQFFDSIASTIDHTLLKADASQAAVDALCEEARAHLFAAVCVNGSRAARAVQRKEETNSPARVAAVIGFPLGASTTASKTAETEELVRLKVNEIDMVLNVGRLKEGDYSYVLADIASVVRAAHAEKALVKVILETCLLTRELIVDACVLSVLAKADFVKTSTGFSTAGANVDDVLLMKYTVGDQARVKASGGVRTHADAIKMIAVGATRIGTSSGVAIVSAQEDGTATPASY